MTWLGLRRDCHVDQVWIGRFDQTLADILVEPWHEKNLGDGDPADVSFLGWHFIVLMRRARMIANGRWTEKVD